MNQANNLYDLNIDSNYLSASYGNIKTNPNVNKKLLKKDKSESKIDSLKKQIKDYEKKNEEFRQKIVNMFELKDKTEIKKLISKNKKPEDNSEKLKSTDFITKKLNKMEDKFEVEKYRREMALINNMDNYQNKINKLLLYREEKEEKIKNAKIKQEKEREKKIDERAIIIDKTMQNKILEAKKNEEKKEEKLILLADERLKEFL